MPWHTTGLALHTADAAPMRPVVVADRTIIMAVLDGRWYAIEDRCSHAGCAFSEDGEFDGARVICDCHGSEFDVRTGAVIRPPAREPIATFPVRVADGILEVEL